MFIYRYMVVYEPTSLHLVRPSPPYLEEEIVAHVIVLQRPQETLCTILVTMYDFTIPSTGSSMQVALTMHEHIFLEQFIHSFGRTQQCLLAGHTQLCQAWHETHQLQLGTAWPGRDGQGFVLAFTLRQPVVEGTVLLQTQTKLLRRAAIDPVSERGERLTTAAVAQAQWPSQTQTIDLTSVFRLFDWLDTHLFLPHFDLPEVVSPNIAASWIEKWWDFVQPGDHLRIYFDGSFAKTPEESDSPAGAAIAAFLHTADGWVFAGALSSSLPEMHSSYTAELAGALVAHKFAFDLLKIHIASTGTAPEVTLCFDALTIGHQAQGDWSCVSHPHFGKSLRAMTLFIEQKFALHIHYKHIRGHTGEPGNELVDGLANAARRHGGLTPFADWVNDMIQPSTVDRLSWLWCLFAEEFAGCWHDGHLCMPGPTTEPDPTVIPTVSSATSHERLDTTAIQIRVTSCNVLSLKGGRDSTSTLAGISREQALLEQLKEEHITIFALQETRLRKLHQVQNPDFFILKAAATDAGHGGILIGVSRKLPYGRMTPAGTTKAAPVYFHDNHLKIVAFDPRYLIVRVATPHLRCLIVAAHAPHTGQEQEVIEAWWEKLYDAVPIALRSWPIILLCDANATVGAHTSRHIGDFHAGKEDPKAEPFESYLSWNDLWLPSTFEAHQQGPGATWTHSTGSMRRIDYIGLPLHWQYDNCQTWVSDVIDPMIIRADHAGVCADLAFTLTLPCNGFTADRTGGSHLELDPYAVHWNGLWPQAHHDLDVHSHFQVLQDNLIHHLRPQKIPRSRRSHKTTMSLTTWNLVCEKRKWRRTLADQTHLQRTTMLEACFAAWKHQRNDIGKSYDELLALQDRLIGQALAQFRRLGLQVTKSMRQDDRAFFENLLQDGADFLEPQQVKQLWAVIRRSLPKFQNRKVGYSPYKLAHLEEQSARHFEELELGMQMQADDLVERCTRAQTVAAHRDLPAQLSYTSLPSLPEVEDALRATRADRATGFDVIPSSVYHKHAAFLGRYFYHVVLKIFAWGTEPIQGKGGFLKMIPKRLGAMEARHFRGILLLPTFAKRIHAIARARLMHQAGRQRDPGQLGGYEGQQVAFGAQTLRALTNIFSAQGLSSAVLYVDLATAFHHLIRQLVTGIGSSTEWQEVLHRLSEANTPVHAGQEGEQLIGVLERLHIDPLLTRLLRDVHESTWYSLSGLIWCRL